MEREEFDHLCIICKEIFVQPYTLVCSHTYCYDCINQYICNKNSTNTPLMYSTKLSKGVRRANMLLRKVI